MSGGFQAFGSGEGFVGGFAGGVPAFDPATLAMTGWYRDYPTFTGTQPWVSANSAGVSGGRTLYHGASSPTSGNFLNGHQTAAFDGTFNSTNALEGSGEQMQQYITAAAWSAWALVKPTVAAVASGDPRQDPAVWDDSGASFWCLNYNANGMNLSQVGNAILVTRTVACSVNNWHIVQAYYDGTNLALRVDSGAWSTAPCSPLGNPAWGGATSYLRLGDSFTGNHIAGQIADFGISNIALSAQDFDNVRAYVNLRYGLSL